jgi:uncharacterized protein Veg
MTKKEQKDPSFYSKSFFSLLKETKTPFNIKVGLFKSSRNNVIILDFSTSEKKLLISGGETFKFQEINELTFSGKNAVKFYKEILPHLPESNDTFLDDKNISIYPFGEKGFLKAKLIKSYPYFFLLHIKQKKGKSSKATHTYKAKYKVFTSAFSPFNPYPQTLIKETGEIYDQVKPGSWREEAKEIGKLLKEIIQDSKEGKIITLALKDGREITGFFNHKKSWKPYLYSLYNPKGKEVIHIFKHAIDDIWEAEE